MKVEPNELEKALADKCAALVKAGHDPEQVALAALDMACGALSAARGPLWLAEQLETIRSTCMARGPTTRSCWVSKRTRLLRPSSSSLLAFRQHSASCATQADRTARARLIPTLLMGGGGRRRGLRIHSD